jgi:hypothetical protein
LKVATCSPLPALPERSLWSCSRIEDLKNFFNASGFLGDPGSVILSAGLYFAGLGVHSRELAALGMHTGESVVLGGVIAEALKGEIGRARPTISPTDSRVFKAGKGFSSDHYASFPSAETTAAFAAATALSRGFSRDWPSHARLMTAVAYTGATLAAGSRTSIGRAMSWPARGSGASRRSLWTGSTGGTPTTSSSGCFCRRLWLAIVAGWLWSGRVASDKLVGVRDK